MRRGGIPLNQKNVQIAVVIVIEQRGARPDHFGKQHFARGAGKLPEVDPNLFGDVLEKGWLAPRGCLTSAQADQQQGQQYE